MQAANKLITFVSMNFTFGKPYHLCGKKKIDAVFQRGVKIHGFPFLSYHLSQPKDDSTFKILVSVPKKFIKKAHERNYIKRCMREGIRKNKELLEELLLLKGFGLDIALVYVSRERKESIEIELKIVSHLKKIRNELQNQLN